MRKLRRRLILLFFSFVILSSIASVTIYWMIQNNILFRQRDIRYLIFGFAVKDLLLMLLALGIGVFFILVFSKRTASPIAALSRAATQIASGNLDVVVEESDRRDEIGELERQFNRMVRELQSNEYLKKDFISNVSHEFKTPLAVISGYAALLAEDGIGESERKAYASQIVSESGRLSELTGNILRLSKLNRDEIRPKMGTFSLDEQIRQCILLLEGKWAPKHLEFELDLEPCECLGDEDLLSEVWLNLIGNAVKFSFPESVIRVSARRDADGTCRVEVEDQGCGMDEATKERIFEQFYQGDTSHKKDGNGLGLSIVQRVLCLHHGGIEVKSEPGKGSLFVVTL